MKQWNGLVCKEWRPVRKQYYFLAAVLLIALFTLPIVLHRFVMQNSALFDIAFTLCVIWTLCSIAVPAYLLIKSLQKELHRPDVWLHSTASMPKLISAKMVPPLLAGAASLLISGLVLFVHYGLAGGGTIHFREFAVTAPVYLLFLFLVSFFILITTYFFMTIHLLLRPYLRSLSLPVTFVLTILSARFYGMWIESGFYQKMSHYGKVRLEATGPIRGSGAYEFTNSYLFHIDFFTGELVLDLLFFAILFFLASQLFEKKVRL